ncbi:hypothetical protein B0H13DRAFT_2345543 [Mycena leptocephala]|nr:hypothetical protein B0H13DRAFT_2345543 [Mycena leptocephala]
MPAALGLTYLQNPDTAMYGFPFLRTIVTLRTTHALALTRCGCDCIVFRLLLQGQSSRLLSRASVSPRRPSVAYDMRRLLPWTVYSTRAPHTRRRASTHPLHTAPPTSLRALPPHRGRLQPNPSSLLEAHDHGPLRLMTRTIDCMRSPRGCRPRPIAVTSDPAAQCLHPSCTGISVRPTARMRGLFTITGAALRPPAHPNIFSPGPP